MNLTSQYQHITKSNNSHQKRTHIEHVPASTYLREDADKEREKLKRLFPLLDEPIAFNDSEQTVLADEANLVDELV